MGTLKDIVDDLQNREDDLNAFKVRLVNKINFKRKSIDLEYKDDEHNYGGLSDDAYSTVFEYPASLAMEILSELGLSSSILETKIGEEQLGANHYESYQYHDFDEVWKVIKDLEPKDFLIAMVVIAASNSHWKSVTTIQQLIIREINHFKLKIDFKKSSVFVAMSFGEDMKKTRQSITKVIEEYGYTPMLIDIKEHNNQIVPEIFYEIENADFVISDLTEQKTGVYLETGYAIAKGKQVILSCSKNDFTNNHFDVSQINTILWDDESDLENRLRQRIKAMHLQNF